MKRNAIFVSVFVVVLFIGFVNAANGPILLFTGGSKGLFSCEYPNTYTLQLYADRRTKVRFYHQDNPRTFLRVIAKLSSADFYDVCSEAQSTVYNMRSRGVTCILDTLLFNDAIQCVRVRSDFSKFNAGYTELYLFVNKGVHFNIQLCTDTRTEMDAAMPEFQQIMKSINVISGNMR